NEPSPVFRSYLDVVTRDGGAYDDDHRDIDVPALVKEAGYRLHLVDGALLFFGSARYVVRGDLELDAFYGRLADLLVAAGGDRYRTFPGLDFTRSDIPVLRQVEECVGVTDRLRFGFIRYYLIDTRSP